MRTEHVCDYNVDAIPGDGSMYYAPGGVVLWKVADFTHGVRFNADCSYILFG